MGNVAQYIKDHKMQINYCEVVIDRNGNIYDAEPSHQDWLVNYYCNLHDITKEILWKMIPVHANPTYYLIDLLGFVSVWYDYIVKPEYLTTPQRHSLKELQSVGQIAPICNVITSREKRHCDYEEEIIKQREGYSYESIPKSDATQLFIDGKFRKREIS